ncbi:hypothetical protein GCM10009525_85140 [Streptosporangium amethystogenes subsp. fukuiense]
MCPHRLSVSKPAPLNHESPVSTSGVVSEAIGELIWRALGAAPPRSDGHSDVKYFETFTPLIAHFQVSLM